MEKDRIQEVMDEIDDASVEDIAEGLDVDEEEVMDVKLDDIENNAEEQRHEMEEFEERVEEHQKAFRELIDEIQEVIVGQEDVVEHVITAIICDGNVLLEGVPGLGKSLLVESLAETITDTEHNRIQFVPDMLPSDILGQRVYNQGQGEFHINKGPVFTNFLLADEINRAPPKTQAALMEVMQEKKVTIGEETFQLEPPYIVLATQNPVEQKGTYPLPEAIMDRFFMKLELNYPDRSDENLILERNSIRDTNIFDRLDQVMDKQQILHAQEDVRDIHLSEEVRDYITRLITTARGETDQKIDMIKYVDYAPSPRASIWLSMGASAQAMLDGRTYATPKDVKDVAKPVLRHRIDVNYEGKLKEIDSNQIVDALLDYVKAE
ncbi:MAG: AAA family ATPase [Candidatus Nanohalobium sp.]